MKPDISEDMVYRYLLGDLPESERLALEEVFFANREAFEQVWAIENDLIDRYARGRLPSAEKALFEKNYLVSPVHRDRLAFARTFVETADSTAERGEVNTGTVPAISWWSSFLASLRENPWRWATVPALLLLAAATIGLYGERVRLRDQMAQTQVERAALAQREQELERQLAEQQSSNADAANELERVRNRLAQLEEQLAAGGEHVEQRDLKVVAFTLASQTRGIGKIPTLTVPPRTDYVALTLDLETDDFPVYEAALKNQPTGQIVWHSGRLKPGGTSSTLRIRLPASLLNAQNFIVVLSGIPASGAAEIVSSYPFRVVTQ